MSTIHSYTADQKLWDALHDDFRRMRAAARSIIPTRTGAAKAIGVVLPELNGKMDGVAYRVPTLDGSVIHLVADVAVDTTKDEVNAALKEASEGDLNGIVQFVEDPLVSEDFIGNSHSAIVDSALTRVTQRRKVIIVAWYDNEWGYSCRLRDVVAHVAKECGWFSEPASVPSEVAFQSIPT
jgi:glyceraldehyde 3-phosphate dehydrogenase